MWNWGVGKMSNPDSEVIKATSLRVADQWLKLVKEMFLYAFVSVFALAVDVGLLFMLVEYAGLHHILAATISFTGGLMVNYGLARLYVFKRSRLPFRQEFMMYAVIGVIGLALNDVIIYILVGLQVWYLYAKAVSVAIVFFFNFFGRRKLFADQ